jgi:superfamily II DNA/RNA helicase
MSNGFEQLVTAPCFLKKLKERNITEPTDIQKKVIPLLSEGQSIFFTSSTGTGKTFAYLLPFLQKISHTPEDGTRERVTAKTQNGESTEARRNFLQLLIISPTLELCTQIKKEIDFLSAETDISSALLIGSVNIERQIENLRKTKPDVIVGNPNRLLVLVRKKLINFNNLRYLVLDEADRLVSDEMTDDTGDLLELVRRAVTRGAKKDEAAENDETIVKAAFNFAACSATLNKKNIKKLSAALYGKSRNPSQKILFIESEDNEILRDKIEHWAIFSEKRRKEQTLRSLLAAISGAVSSKKKKKSKIKTLVFTSRGDEAAIMLSRLQFHHIRAAGLFGKAGKKPLGAQERKTALESFRSGDADVLVSTDLAARGLDIEGITHVIALDVPDDSEVYIHRCGRTGRAGKRGVMVTIGDETQMRLLAAMEKKLKIKIYPKELHYGQILAPDEIEEK